MVRSLLAKPWLVMPTAALVMFGGWYAVDGRGGSGAGSNSAIPTEQIVQVTQATMARTVSAQGTVAAVDSDDMAFTAAGTVTAVNVKAGQAVAAGDVLATLDSPALRQAVSDAESKLADAKATLADDTAAGASSSRLDADRANVTTAQNQLTEANTALAGATLKAPYAAKVTAVGLTVGEKLGSSGGGGNQPTGSDSGSGRTANNLGDSNGNGASSVISLISLDAYKVKLGLDASDVASVADGQPAKLTLSSASSNNRGNFPGGALFRGFAQATAGNNNTTATTTPIASDAATATGAVAAVSSVADASSGVASYPVEVTFNDNTGSFNVGATVQVDITISEVKDALQVPSMALQSNGSTATVTVRNASGKDETRSVTTGLVSGAMTQITSGLRVGEQVVVQLPRLGNPGGGNNARTLPAGGDFVVSAG